MKKILGLDLGTNSIGWAVVNSENDENGDEKIKCIEAAGSRIIPMDAATLGDFAKGNTKSQTKERTDARGIRRLHERHLLRRERLNRVLSVMGFLPEHYDNALTRYGKFKDDKECKIAWKRNDDGKWTFIFMDSFNEMLSDFATCQPDWLAGGKKVPYDWTIYYLRKKALSRALTKQELAWLLLNFNQKRGYYQLRGEDEQSEDKGKLVEYYAVKVVDVKDTGEKKGKDTWFDVILENGMVYHRPAAEAPDWIGKTKEFIVTTDVEKDGTPKKDKDGNIKRSFRMPKEDDWTLIKKKTESDIDSSGKTVGEYIYDSLLADPTQKIKGKLVRTVERKYYKSELKRILDSQKRFIPELNDRTLYTACIEELYESNDAYRQSIASYDFTYLFVDNIIFYQRPLKSKKSLIDNCPYESRSYVDKETGEVKTAPVKCVAKSNPLFQEFRLWQFISNIRIYERQKIVDGHLKADVDVTGEFIKDEDDVVRLFDFLNDRKEIKQDTLLGTYFKVKKPKGKDRDYPYRWNYVEDKIYPCNETRALMLKGLKDAGVDEAFLDKANEYRLWHILYSVDDKQEIKKAMATFVCKYNKDEENKRKDKNNKAITLDDRFVEAFSALPPFKKEYGSYSEKAIRRLLPLMRMGKYWNVEAIDAATRVRINNIIDGVYDETIMTRVREKAVNLTDVSQFRGLPLWLACYVVYNRHSEAKDVSRWNSPDDIDRYLSSFKQHSLRNPIVEQVITETLRTVRDIWRQYGRIDEIHVEMGRDLKNPADVRAKMSKRVAENENANLRIKALLTEFVNPDFEIDNVRPYSPSQQDMLRIYEEGVLESMDEVPDYISEIISKFSQTDEKKRPTHAEIIKYKLWLDQKYQSPYTGRTIPLARLFTDDYQIEHVIPKARYFDDSMSNKVICEAEVNQLKDRLLGYEFIKAHHGEKVSVSIGDPVTVLSVEEYEQLVQRNFRKNPMKMKKLLMDDIPDGFVERQLNDSRYISKVVKSLLSNMVREKDECEATSKNVITCNGAITDRLKHEWGVADAWNRIVLPRFERLNRITGTSQFTTPSTNGHLIPDMPLSLQKGFNKKRIDHRHHAMDAIVIACTTRSHVNLLSNEAAMSKNKSTFYQLSHKLRRYESVIVTRNGETRTMSVAREFFKPWPTFTVDVEKALRNIIVSFKQNLRVINKTTNKYQCIENGKKRLKSQVKGDSWAIRKPMHKDTVYGEVNLRRIDEVQLKYAVANPKTVVDKDLKKKLMAMMELGFDLKKIKQYFEDNRDAWQDINLKKIKVYYFTKETNDRFFATRFGNDIVSLFAKVDKQSKAKDIISSITDIGIQKILLRHLEASDNDVQKAFSAEGVEQMNRNIVELNNGKPHKPIYKVRKYEQADKFAVGVKGNKGSKFVEAAKGTNLFFAVYQKETVDSTTGEIIKKRIFDTIPLKTVIDRQKNMQTVAPEEKDGAKLLFVLSPNDLVYLPTDEEISSGIINQPLGRDRIYKMVSCTGTECYFIPFTVAIPIVDKIEYFSLNKIGRALTGEMIKEICVPIKVDRLGNVIEINNQAL